MLAQVILYKIKNNNNLIIELPCDPAIPLLSIYLKKTKTQIWKDTCTSVFKAALFTTAKIRNQPKRPSTDEWIKIYSIQWTTTQL